MQMRPAVRKFALTAHIASSVGWLGAVAVFLALAGVASTSGDPRTVRAVYLVLEPAAWLVLVPLAFASLLTGLVQSLGTHWGLFRHYWVLFKLLINVFATAVLLGYTQTLDRLAAAAAEQTASGLDQEVLQAWSVALHAAAALLLLLVATILAVYKPRGLTPYGRRKRDEEQRRKHQEHAAPVP